uniref:Uncharacterized protein n=1 Tax=Amphimedon queenslandica TaxID=400682 RepID=A0A1X7SU89_AMPQE
LCMRDQYCPTNTNCTLANLLTRQGTSLQTKSLSSTNNTRARSTHNKTVQNKRPAGAGP